MAAKFAEWMYENHRGVRSFKCSDIKKNLKTLKGLSNLIVVYNHSKKSISFGTCREYLEFDSNKWSEFIIYLNAAIPEMTNLNTFEYIELPRPEGASIKALTNPMSGLTIFATNTRVSDIPQHILNGVKILKISDVAIEELLSDNFPVTSIGVIELGYSPIMSWDQFRQFTDKFRDVEISHPNMKFSPNVEKPDNIVELQEEYNTDDWELIKQRYCEQPMLKYAGKIN
jgi:hypothetical protein